MQEFQKQGFGDYILHDRIGAGGMAEIFLATAQGIEGFEKRLVIKRILPTLSDDEQFVRMFIEEAKLCVALRHPNIVQVYDLGEIDLQYYIAMEYVDGRDLLKTLAACGRKKIGFPTDIALYIVMEVLKGLDYAHKLTRPDGLPLGIIHRDVSPSNVLLSFEGEVKIGDFGIAKASTREKTATGILKGKFGYMAPEQVTGAPIDHKADIFAVGIVLYELLTGHRLFAGKNDLAVLERVRDARIDPPPRHYRPDLSPELEGIVLSALSRSADDRFKTAAELHDAVHDYVYRSRATVGPAHLGRFMQALFLSDPEEIDRRNRVRLPPVPANGLSRATAEPPRIFGYEPTDDERGVLDNAATKDLEPNDPDGDFSEKTPLLDEEEARALSMQRRHSSLSDQVALIAPDDNWSPEPSREASVPSFESPYAHPDYGIVEDDITERGEGVSFDRSSRSVPVVSPQPLSEVAGDFERTVRTDVSIEVADSQVEAIQIRQATEDRNQAAHGSDPKAEVAALRRAQKENDPTDWDLEDDPRFAALVSGPGPREESRTRSGRPPGVQSDRPEPVAKTRRTVSAIDTELSAEGDEVRDSLEEDFKSERTFSPAEIVERSSTTGDEDEAVEGVEPTVRFDSRIAPSARGGQDPTDPITSKPRSPPTYDGVGESSDYGTFEVEGGDLPTAEVDDSEIRDLAQEARTDSGPGVPEPVARPPSPSSPFYPSHGYAPELDDDTEMSNEPDASTIEGEAAPDPFEDEDETGILGAATEQNAPSTKDADEDDETSRTQTMDRGQDGVPVGHAAIRAASFSAPARRRPIPATRGRPVLLPIERDGSSTAAGPAIRSPSITRPTAQRRNATRHPISVVNPGAAARLAGAVPRGGSSIVRRASTGAGSLVAEAHEPFPPVDPTTPEPLPDRRLSSGVTAALNEAAMIQEEIAEIRRDSVVPHEPTSLGALAGIDESAVDAFEPDEATQNGSDIRSAIMRRQSRRRLVTQSFVLYSEDDKQPRRAAPSFREDEEQSVPAITSAGRLEDDGASDLFGVLSVLDEPDFGSEPEEVSLETDARHYDGLEESLGERGASTIPTPAIEDRPESVAAREEYGATSFGSLAPDTAAGPVPRGSPLPEGMELDFEDDEEETTASVTDGQVLSVSQAMRLPQQAGRQNVIVDPAREDSIGSGTERDHRARDGSGIDIDLSGIRLPNEDMSADGMVTVLDEDSDEDLLELRSGAWADAFPETDEPTQEQGAKARGGASPYDVLDERMERSPVPDEPEGDWERTSDQRPSKTPGLISESFDFGVDRQAELRRESPRQETPPRPPVRPVSLAAPLSMEPTASQLADLEDSPSPKVRVRRPGKESALRAVVERHRIAKELNRSRPDIQRATPSAMRGNDGVPARASPTPVFGYPPRATATPPMAMPPGRAAPTKGVPPPSKRRVVTLTNISYVFVGIAVILSVAVAVSSLLIHGRPVPIAPIAQPDRVPPAPPEETAAAEMPPEELSGPAERAPPPEMVAPPEPERAPPAQLEEAPEPKRVPPAQLENAPPEPKRTPPAQLEEAPPDPKKVAPKRAPRRRARRAARAPEPKTVSRPEPPTRTAPPPASGTAALNLRCNSPVDIRIRGASSGSWSDQTRLTQNLPPGRYQVLLSRGGKPVSQLALVLVAGQSVDVPCP